MERHDGCDVFVTRNETIVTINNVTEVPHVTNGVSDVTGATRVTDETDVTDGTNAADETNVNGCVKDITDATDVYVLLWLYPFYIGFRFLLNRYIGYIRYVRYIHYIDLIGFHHPFVSWDLLVFIRYMGNIRCNRRTIYNGHVTDGTNIPVETGVTH